MKKLLSVFLILSIVMSFVGCGKKEIPTTTNEQSEEQVDQTGELKPEEGAELTFWGDSEEYGQAIVDGFMKKYPDVKVTFEKVGLESMDKIALDGPAGKGADVFIAPHDKLGDGINSGIVLPIDERVTKELDKTVNAKAEKTVTKDEKLYGVPVSLETLALFYNKDIVKDEPAKSFEEIFEFAKEYNDPAHNKFAFLHNIADGYGSYAFLTPYGFKLFGEDGLNQEDPGFSSPEFLKGLKFISSIKEIVPVNSIDLKDEFVGEQFITGKVAYVIGGPWDIKKFQDAEMNFGVTTIPTVDNNIPTPFAGVKIAFVSAYTEYPNASNLLAQYLVSNEGAGILYNTTKKITVLSDVSNIEGLKDDKLSQGFIKQFNNSFPMPTVKRISYYWSIGEKAMGLAFDQKLTPEEAAKKAQEEWESLVASE